MRTGYLFSRCMVALVSRMAIEQFGTHSNFARATFKENKDPINVWRQLRNQTGKDKRKLSLDDVCAISETLHLDVASLCKTVSKEIEAGWSESEDVQNLERMKGGSPKRHQAASCVSR